MPVRIICGLQWGDEGKGKLTHLLSDEADVVARYAGGPNSGHTIISGGKKFVFHVVPAGIFKPNSISLIGPGTVIDPMGLINELEGVASQIDYNGRIFISESAHMILEYHRYKDKLDEIAKGKAMLGTTLRGIGPTYADKANRTGIKLGLLKDEDKLREAISRNLDNKNRSFVAFGAEPLSFEQVFGPVMAARDKILPLLGDVCSMAQDYVKRGKYLLLEGNQGVLLDIDHGTYPFVTSSSCVPASGLATFGLSPHSLTDIIGVAKSYQTRVGKGPMPTIQNNETGQIIRERGKEYGSSTGRPRDCGFLDLVALKYAIQVSGATKMGLTLLDVLDVFGKINVCVAYETQSGTTDKFINDADFLSAVKPVYKELDGWKEDISQCKNYNDLPGKAKEYIKFLEDYTGIPVCLVSVGPDEKQTIRRAI